MTVRIVTDSVSDLPAQVVQELGISVVSLNVTFGKEIDRDGIDMTAEQLIQCKTLPVTSVPSPIVFTAICDKLAEETDEVIDTAYLNKSRSNMRTIFDILKYLKKGGRIGRATALLDSMPKVNPLITIKDSEVEPAGRTRCRARAIDNLANFVMSYSNIEEIAVEDAACPDEAGILVERLSSRLPRERMYRLKTTPVPGTNTGHGVLMLTAPGDK